MPDINEMYNEAERLKDEGHYEAAIERLNQLLQEDGTHVLSHLALAVLYGRVSQHEKAIEHAHRACELDDRDPFNFTAMSVTYQRAWQGTQNPRFIHLAEEAMARAHYLESQR